MGAVIALIFQLLMRSQLCKIDKKKKGALYECVEKESLIRIVYRFEGDKSLVFRYVIND